MMRAQVYGELQCLSYRLFFLCLRIQDKYFIQASTFNNSSCNYDLTLKRYDKIVSSSGNQFDPEEKRL